eukprot:6461573-Prymnesium_polylepis.1
MEHVQLERRAGHHPELERGRRRRAAGMSGHCAEVRQLACGGWALAGGRLGGEEGTLEAEGELGGGAQHRAREQADDLRGMWRA